MGTGCSKQQISILDRVPGILARTLYHKTSKQTTDFTFFVIKDFAREQWSQAQTEYKELDVSYQNIHIYCCPLYQHSIIINTQAICTGSTHTPTYTKTHSSHNSSCLAIAMAIKSTAHQPGKHIDQSFTLELNISFYVHKISYNSQRTLPKIIVHI